MGEMENSIFHLHQRQIADPGAPGPSRIDARDGGADRRSRAMTEYHKRKKDPAGRSQRGLSVNESTSDGVFDILLRKIISSLPDYTVPKGLAEVLSK